MKTYIALLRGVNVGGNKLVSMAELRTVPGTLGFANAVTVLNSGNVVFDGAAKSAAAIERLLEDAIAKRFGHRSDVFVRDAPAWQALVDGNPFHAEARDEPGHLIAMCLKDAPPKGAGDRLSAAIVGRERAHVEGRVAYLVYPDGAGTSKLTVSKIEKALGTSGTGRNWNTVLKLHDLVRR